ncbi:MAG: hypothetical protein A2X56_09790 [Nitrospirae bacterium GWC2_57_13]|jgi:two-component system, cell cycle sensor histidine kinase and response regulator CckA|nr:MAG: hypothetical protein A2X56_09790 [Nitrospirae bacterium GWC2_57_13]OGW44376.1 MAG: hypothetical protein A2X57_10770 [Nitrospirae bacterium GWD2_57_8]
MAEQAFGESDKGTMQAARDAAQKIFFARTVLPAFAALLLLFLISAAAFLWYDVPTSLFAAQLLVLSLSGTAGYYAYRSMIRRMEQSLTDQRSYYQGIVESRHESVLVIDRDFLVRDLNNNYLKATGRSRDDVLGKPCYAVSHGRTTPCPDTGDHPCPVRYAFDTGKRRSCVHTHYRQFGERYEVEVSASPLVMNGGQVSLVVETIRDVTELKHLKTLFLQSQKMETVGRLTGGIAHDFNNLMNVVIGYSEMLLNRAPSNGPDRVAMQSILDAGERAANLTNQLLAFSRKRIIEPRVLDLNVVIADMDRMLQRVIGEDVELLAVQAEHLGRVKADPGMIEQVMMNLAVNARDAMPEGGKLVIETANVELDDYYVLNHRGSKPGTYVMIAVSDTGSGMTSDVTGRIFEPFFTTKGMDKGTGLGLSTVYGIVKQHDGYIMVYSEPDRGTTFKIYLPLAEGDADVVGRKRARKVPKGTESVLLVEDDEGLRTIASQMLEGLGYLVVTASCGEDALRLLSQRSAKMDLLFTDVVMPGIGGKVLAEKAQSLLPGLKVLFTSGYTDNAITHGGVLDSGMSFIQKPFTSSMLGWKIREVLDGRQ